MFQKVGGQIIRIGKNAAIGAAAGYAAGRVVSDAHGSEAGAKHGAKWGAAVGAVSGLPAGKVARVVGKAADRYLVGAAALGSKAASKYVGARRAVVRAGLRSAPVTKGKVAFRYIAGRLRPIRVK